MAISVNIHEAKTNLSKLIVKVGNGEEIIISKAGTPVAKLIPIRKKMKKRVLGGAKDKVWIADDFDAPLPQKVESMFYT